MFSCDFEYLYKKRLTLETSHQVGTLRILHIWTSLYSR